MPLLLTSIYMTQINSITLQSCKQRQLQRALHLSEYSNFFDTKKYGYCISPGIVENNKNNASLIKTWPNFFSTLTKRKCNEIITILSRSLRKIILR